MTWKPRAFDEECLLHEDVRMLGPCNRIGCRHGVPSAWVTRCQQPRWSDADYVLLDLLEAES